MNKIKWIEETANIIIKDGYISEYQDDNHKIHDIEQNKGNLDLLKDLKTYLETNYDIDIRNFSAEIVGDGWSTILYDTDKMDYKRAIQNVQNQYNMIVSSNTQFRNLYSIVPIV